MSVNASQLDLNQLIYRHLKEHGFLSAAEELQRHSPQEETNPSVSLLDIYKSWLKDPKKKKRPNSAKCSKSGQERTSSKATPRRKMDKTVKNPASPKKSVRAKRTKMDEKPGQSVVKAKKSKLNTTEKAAADGSDSDSSLDVEKWKKLLDQLTEADVAKMETINALFSSEPQPKEKRVRKPRAKLPKTDAPVQQNVVTTGQNEKVEEKVVTQTPAKKGRKENAAHVSTPGTLSPNKRVKTPETQTQLQDMVVPLNAQENKTDEMAPEPKKNKKKKKEKKENEEKTEGNANETNGDGKDRKQKKRNEITEQEDVDQTEEKTEESNRNTENISELGLQKKKTKKKEKGKTRSEEESAQIDEKKEKKMADNEDTSAQLVQEIKPNTNKVGSDKNSEQNVQDKKAKKKKEKNDDGNLEHVPLAEVHDVKQNVEEKENSEKLGKKKKAKEKKEKTRSEENTTQIHEKKKKNMLNNEGHLEQEDTNVEQTATDTNEAGSNKKSEENVHGKKAKRKKEKNNMDGNLEHATVAEEKNNKPNVEVKENSEQIGEKKKAKEKKEKPSNEENSTQIHEKKKKKMLNNEEYLEQEDTNVEQTTTNTNEATSSIKSEPNVHGKKPKRKKEKHNMEGNLEHAAVAEGENNEPTVKDKGNSGQNGSEKKAKKKKKESVISKETSEEEVREKKAKKKNKRSDKDHLNEDVHTDNTSTLETSEWSLETTSPPKKKKRKKNKLKSEEVPDEDKKDFSTTQANSADVHNKGIKSKSTKS